MKRRKNDNGNERYNGMRMQFACMCSTCMFGMDELSRAATLPLGVPQCTPCCSFSHGNALRAENFVVCHCGCYRACHSLCSDLWVLSFFIPLLSSDLAFDWVQGCALVCFSTCCFLWWTPVIAAFYPYLQMLRAVRGAVATGQTFQRRAFWEGRKGKWGRQRKGTEDWGRSGGGGEMVRG